MDIDWSSPIGQIISPALLLGFLYWLGRFFGTKILSFMDRTTQALESIKDKIIAYDIKINHIEKLLKEIQVKNKKNRR